MAFAGFDRSAYPGDALMTRMLATTNLKWCGYYLFPAPSHTSDGSWMGKRVFLQGLGWGLAPIYVGQQTAGPGSHHASQEQGKIDGADAVALMKHEGFAAGSFVYLDLENGPPLPAILKQYLGAWCDAVVAGGFLAGVYVSHHMVQEVHDFRPDARIWAIFVHTTDHHAVPGPPFPEADPSGSGFPGAFMWQAHQNAEITVPGPPTVLTPVDLDTAKTGNPLV